MLILGSDVIVVLFLLLFSRIITKFSFQKTKKKTLYLQMTWVFYLFAILYIIVGFYNSKIHFMYPYLRIL